MSPLLSIFSSCTPARGPPPFPYTTLFRSWSRRVLLSQPADGRWLFFPRLSGDGRVDAVGVRVPTARSARQDRKSTRLNSSHVASSYAVVCLKKKKRMDVLDGPTVRELASI